MSDPVKWCPGCNQRVEVELTAGAMYKCKNCWRLYRTLAEIPVNPQRRSSDADTPTN